MADPKKTKFEIERITQMQNCKDCIWFDKCGSTTPCEYYETEDSPYTEKINNYKHDLAMRESVYEELIDEQNA